MEQSLMGNYEETLMPRAIENLYDKVQSAVLFNSSTGEWFRTTAEVRPGCLLSPTLFNIFLERIMYEALDDHKGSVSIGGRLITNFLFADDIVVNAEEEEEGGVLVDRLDTTTTRCKMEPTSAHYGPLLLVSRHCFNRKRNIVMEGVMTFRTSIQVLYIWAMRW